VVILIGTYFLIDIPCHPYFAKKEIDIYTSGVKEDAESGVKGGVKGGVKEPNVTKDVTKELTERQSVILDTSEW